jgi:hypothetical protein
VPKTPAILSNYYPGAVSFAAKIFQSVRNNLARQANIRIQAA